MNQILVIDDDQGVREMLSLSLSREGYQVIEAENGKQGLELYDTHKTRVIILDLSMPVMGGIEFLKKFGQEKLHECIVIVLSGNGDDESIENCYDLGVHSYLRKPVNLTELYGLVKRSFQTIQNNFEIRQLNARLSSVLSSVPDLVWECDQDLKFTYVSNNSEQILGYKPQQLIGKKLTDYLHEKDLKQFDFKFFSQGELNEKVRGVMLSMTCATGEEVKMQISANRRAEGDGLGLGLVGVSRVVAALSGFIESAEEKPGIRINSQYQITYINEEFESLFSTYRPEGQDSPVNFSSLLMEQDQISLFEFGFSQQEDIPFPVEIKVQAPSGKDCFFSVNFSYQQATEELEGRLLPLEADDQMAMMNDKIEAQKKIIESTALIDSATLHAIIEDSKNLSSDILNILRSLEPFAFQDDLSFDLKDLQEFFEDKNISKYQEEIKALENKLHSYKGTNGYVILAIKKITHEIEELVRPLNTNQIVFTQRILLFLKQFVFKTQDMLELFQKDSSALFESESLDWLEKIQLEGKWASRYIQEDLQEYTQFMLRRSKDKGEVRKRKEVEYLSVSQEGYIKLSEQIKSFFYNISQDLQEDHLVKVGNQFNEILNTHQQIKKIPLDITRYERLIPSLAEDYGKQAEFIIKDRGVLADREFWNGTYELLSHVIKNAVIHGLESPSEREALNKSKKGKIIVELREDALNIFLTVADDGKGLDIDKICEKALENNLVQRAALDQMSTEERLNLVFLQGVSTAESLDDNAGRGVGLNAVQEIVNSLQGSCRIDSQKGEGTTWHFTMPKSNVSLPCFIVSIGDFMFAIPEDNIDCFYGYEEDKLALINQKTIYKQNDTIIPMLDPKVLFSSQISTEQDKIKRIIILKSNHTDRFGLVINEIIHHATLPILPLPEEFGDMPAYSGATTYGNEPVLVLDTNKL